MATDAPVGRNPLPPSYLSTFVCCLQVAQGMAKEQQPLHRLLEDGARPSVPISPTQEEGVGEGGGRQPTYIDLMESLDYIATTAKDEVDRIKQRTNEVQRIHGERRAHTHTHLWVCVMMCMYCR